MVYAEKYGFQYSDQEGLPSYARKRLVPRISDKILDSVIYLYPSREHAERGERAGGSGFFVDVPTKNYEGMYLRYAVTNSHVIREGNSPVIRLNTRDGGFDVLEVGSHEWLHHQDGDDLAVCPVSVADPNRYQANAIPARMFLTKELIEEHNIGPGDETFMVGRFVSYEGRQRNTPLARFGNISMMPWEPVTHRRGIEQESFLVETRSLSGFSGSPVFVYIPMFAKRPGEGGWAHEAGPWLLGVDWAHFPDYENVERKILKGSPPFRTEEWEKRERRRVKINTGQMMVVPAWELQELLNREELVLARNRAEEEHSRLLERSPVELDAMARDTGNTTRPDTDPKTFTEDDFEDALDRTSRRESQPDPES